MSLTMNLIFLGLISEMITITLLLVPLPLTVQSKLTDIYFNKIVVNQHFKIGIIFIQCIIGMMFLDSLKNSVRFSNGTELPYESKSKIFYNQRNLYITGFIQFLGFAIFSIFLLLRSLVKNKRILLDQQVVSTTAKTTETTTLIELEELKDQLKLKTLDSITLTKQLNNLQKSYDNLTFDDSSPLKKDE